MSWKVTSSSSHVCERTAYLGILFWGNCSIRRSFVWSNRILNEVVEVSTSGGEAGLQRPLWWRREVQSKRDLSCDKDSSLDHSLHVAAIQFYYLYLSWNPKVFFIGNVVGCQFSTFGSYNDRNVLTLIWTWNRHPWIQLTNVSRLPNIVPGWIENKQGLKSEITDIACLLVASSFYFERNGNPVVA